MADLSENFAIMQERLKQPSCFGKYGKPAKELKCGFCWFHPNCKTVKPKTEAKPKKGTSKK